MTDPSSLRIGDLVLYKNNQFIAFNKPATIPVQDDPQGDKSLHALGEIYTKGTLFLTHRIDRPASGIVLFAKTKSALAAVNEQFRERLIEKKYLAVVGNPPPEKSGTLRHYLRKDGRTNRTQASDQPAGGAQEAVLNYEWISSSENYHLLKIDLITGRHHQIRAQLAAIGCPIKGDVKYGFRRSNRDRSIHLHAWQLAFTHPVSQERVHLEAPPPDEVVWNALCTEIGN
ncbi:MAG: RNA pseudouridine synthase [Lewinellaceae bacterium]|nr:RNA pseudouridine synthase [Lewinellaceae bacterium]